MYDVVKPGNLLGNPIANGLITVFDIVLTLMVTNPPTPAPPYTDYCCFLISTADLSNVYIGTWDVNLPGKPALAIRFPWQNNLPCTVRAFFVRSFTSLDGQDQLLVGPVTTGSATPNAADSPVPDISGLTPAATVSFPAVNNGIPSF